MNLLDLALERFGSYRSSTTFTFPTKPGLYFLHGDNRVEPRLGANAAGKSKLWDALYWLLFDRTCKGLRAGDVVTWGEAKGARVALRYTTGRGEVCEVVRTWGPNTWTLSTAAGQQVDLTKDPSNPLLDALRVDAVPFLHTVLMAQGMPMFLDLGPEPQAALFSQVLNLEVWLERSRVASATANEQDRLVRACEQEVARLEGEFAAMQEVGDWDQLAQDWAADRKAKLIALAQRYESALAHHDRLKAGHRQAREDMDAAEVHLRAAVAVHREASAGLQAAQREEAKGAAELTHAKQAQQAGEQAKRDGLCPTCGQRLPHRHAVKDSAGDVVLLATMMSRYANAVEAAEIAEGHATTLLEQARTTADRARDHVRDQLRALQTADRDLDALEEQADELQTAVNPFGEQATTHQHRRAQLQDQLAKARARLEVAQERYRLLTVWVRGFKELRLLEMTEALAELEVEVDAALASMGLEGVRLLFDVDRESKRGTVQRGFTVQVTSPHNPKPVPWRAWSGGEAQRLRLATEWGLGQLIRNRLGVDVPLEVWDEPTQGLSPQGVQELLDALRQRAHEEQRQIWVCDHHTLGYGAFDGVAVATKDQAGSRVAFCS